MYASSHPFSPSGIPHVPRLIVKDNRLFGEADRSKVPEYKCRPYSCCGVARTISGSSYQCCCLAAYLGCVCGVPGRTAWIRCTGAPVTAPRRRPTQNNRQWCVRRGRPKMLRPLVNRIKSVSRAIDPSGTTIAIQLMPPRLAFYFQRGFTTKTIIEREFIIVVSSFCGN